MRKLSRAFQLQPLLAIKLLKRKGEREEDYYQARRHLETKITIILSCKFDCKEI